MAKNCCQKKPKFLEILGTKVDQFWCYTKLIKNKKVAPKLIFFNEIFFRKIWRIFDIEIDFENQILALFDVYFWPFNKSHEKINIIFVISAIKASIWNVFIKFRWHDEKLTSGLHAIYTYICTLKQSQVGMTDMVEMDLGVDPSIVFLKAFPFVINNVDFQTFTLLIQTLVELASKELHTHNGENQPKH